MSQVCTCLCVYGCKRSVYVCVAKSVGTTEKDVCIYKVGSEFTWFPLERRLDWTVRKFTWITITPKAGWFILWQNRRVQIQHSHLVVLQRISCWLHFYSAKTFPETLHFAPEWVAQGTIWLERGLEYHKTKHSQDETVILFSLCLSHYCHVNMHNIWHDDTFLNVTESAGQAEGADVSNTRIYQI